MSDIADLKATVQDTNKIVTDMNIRLTSMEASKEATEKLREKNEDLKNENLQLQITQNEKQSGVNNTRIVDIYEKLTGIRKLIFGTWATVALCVLGVVLDKVF